MTADELKNVITEHGKWLRGEDGSRANLRGADLSWANLSQADLSQADLSWANLSQADLSQADLSQADLSWANLSRADLSWANLSNTCLDGELYDQQRQFCKKARSLHTGGRIVYRTVQSQNVGNQKYTPGHTYTAPFLSFDCNTDCHPGIYAGTLQQIQGQYPNMPLVRCYVRDGDWVINRKGIRCRKLRVLGYVEELA